MAPSPAAGRFICRPVVERKRKGILAIWEAEGEK